VRAAELLPPITIEHALTSLRRPRGRGRDHRCVEWHRSSDRASAGRCPSRYPAGKGARRVSPAKAHAELGWRPAFPTYLDGISDLVNAAGLASASAR
jgi:nucleoside-diphosphate-sugar epimerase